MKGKTQNRNKRFDYYTVWKGRIIGVFDNWDDCLMSIEYYPDNQFLGFNSYEEAVIAFKMGSLEAYRKWLKDKEGEPGDLW